MFQISLHKLFLHHLHYWWCLPSRQYLVWDISFATDTYFNFDNYNRNFFLVNREWKSCVQIIELMLRIQLQLILTDFLSKILLNESDGGKCLCNNLKDILPMLVLTFFMADWWTEPNNFSFPFSLFIIAFFLNFWFSITQFISKATIF